MRPLDPRLISRIGPARRYVIITASLGALTATLVVAQALVIARVLAPVLSPRPLETDGLGWWGAIVPLSARDLGTAAVTLLLIVGARAFVTWVQERQAHRAGTRVISELRTQVVEHATQLGHRWSVSGAASDTTTLATRGLDNLMPYFVRYLPQLMLAATVTPLMLVIVLGLDWVSAAIVAGTLPLVPIFMVLVGLLTREKSEAHLIAMQRLSSRTLDLIVGIPTLRGFGREQGPGARVRELGDAHRRATMGSLRIAFLSGLVLELLTTLSVAIVAVTMGFRLIDGNVGIETALAVLVLAPEVYLPLRNVGTHFHASTDGLAAADAAFDFLATSSTEPPESGVAPRLEGATLTLTSVSVVAGAGTRLAPADLTVAALPGVVTVLRGANGGGKSTAIAALAGLVVPTSGTVTATCADMTTVVLAGRGGSVERLEWSRQCAWVPQRVDLGPPGRLLSLGQRHRIALDRAFASGRPVLLLDEPTAHLDHASRTQVIARIRAAALAGATVVVATHEDELIAAADRVIVVSAQEGSP